MHFTVSVNSEQIADQLRVDVEQLEQTLKAEIKTLAIRTHAFIAEKARSELSGFMYEWYMGRKGPGGALGENLRILHVSDNLHVVELDQKAAFIEDGRPKIFMQWLLDSPKAKTSKDGKKYAVIPFTLAKFKGSMSPPRIPALETMAKAAFKNIRPKMAMRSTAYDASGRPIHGKIADVPIPEPDRSVQGFHSRPRSKEMAALTGLPAHEGIFYGKGASLRQKVSKKGGKFKVDRGIMTFRVISEKHRAEGRWMAPEVKPFGGFPAAHKWAMEQLDIAVASLGQQLGMGNP
jgi:hypothetical protein